MFQIADPGTLFYQSEHIPVKDWEPCEWGRGRKRNAKPGDIVWMAPYAQPDAEGALALLEPVGDRKVIDDGESQIPGVEFEIGSKI